MKKRIFLLAFISLLLLAGCNQEGDEPSVPYCASPICWRSEEDFLADKASKFQSGEFDYGTLLRPVPAAEGVTFGQVNEYEHINGYYYYGFAVSDEKEAEEAFVTVYIHLSPDSYENIVKDHGRDGGKCWVEDVLYDPLNNKWTVSLQWTVHTISVL